jgi:hypothetical protein
MITGSRVGYPVGWLIFEVMRLSNGKVRFV